LRRSSANICANVLDLVTRKIKQKRLMFFVCFTCGHGLRRTTLPLIGSMHVYGLPTSDYVRHALVPLANMTFVFILCFRWHKSISVDYKTYIPEIVIANDKARREGGNGNFPQAPWRLGPRHRSKIFCYMFDIKTVHLNWAYVSAYVSRQLLCDDFSTNLIIAWMNGRIQYSVWVLLCRIHTTFVLLWKADTLTSYLYIIVV